MTQDALATSCAKNGACLYAKKPVAVLLEGLQAFMPDRSSYYMAGVYSAAGCWPLLCLLSSSFGHGGGFNQNGRTEIARKKCSR